MSSQKPNPTWLILAVLCFVWGYLVLPSDDSHVIQHPEAYSLEAGLFLIAVGVYLLVEYFRRKERLSG